MNRDKHRFQARIFPSPFYGRGVRGEGVREKRESGFEQRGALLRAFQHVLQEGTTDEGR